ncbi:related to RWD domain-containing protein-Laccaria bicolor [Serendipita indica DSM 11827]|uniref:Related to RWD domain-containing protein-Laccaria bicolor n=1 Tax=Serendipita indica (strain DSM 11827) TaxID=1109443 RepID=G4TR81_SERID|nr:related to RWD domain-containing protein-Laccaria bicolor [Serendipita indica DSM 11827]
MSDEVLAEEFEVLESIYPDEMTKISDRQVSILVEPEEPVSGLSDFKLVINVTYPPEYPDVYPEVSLEPSEESQAGELTSEEESKLLKSLEETGNENIGMAMTFTLVSHLREQLSSILQERAEKIKREEMEKERRAIEEEEARTRGTPVTKESFLKWRAAFTAEQAEKKRKEDEERMKGWTPKEREEAKRIAARLSGRQLFERGGPQALSLEDSALEGGESVDISLFDRTEREERPEDNEGIHLSDSD